MSDINPYAAPAVDVSVAISTSPVTVSSVLAEGFTLFLRNFPVFGPVVILLWLPAELLTSYLEAWYFAPDEFMHFFWMAQLSDITVGVVVTYAVVSIVAASASGTRIQLSFAEAPLAVLRLFWTRLVVGLLIGLGTVLCLLPGIYLAIRCQFAESVCVIERVSGPVAIQRSFALTEGRLLFSFLLGLVSTAIMIGLSVLVAIPAEFVPGFDHWIVSAMTSLILDFGVAFGTVLHYAGYRQLNSTLTAAQPPTS